MMISEGSGMHADSMAIRMTMPTYPIDEIVVMISVARGAMMASSNWVQTPSSGRSHAARRQGLSEKGRGTISGRGLA